MPSRRDLSRAQSVATMEATRLHFALETQFDSPVDVLGIAKSLDLVLMMQPLDNLLGFYVRRPEAAGIVINSRVPESLQRFTLAHEIGHHVLGHEGTADDHHALNRFDAESLVEVQAQAFAAALLMPLPLVNQALRDLPASKQGRKIQEADAYLFSRQLGVSYSAGVWALYRRRLLSLGDARQFIKSGALAAKVAVAGEAPRGNARADVWALTEENDNLTVLCRVGDEINVQLTEDTSTGLAWAIRAPTVNDFYHPATAHNALSWDGDDEVATAQPPAPSPEQGAETVQVIQDEHRSELNSAERDLVALAEQNDWSFPGPAGTREVTFVPLQAGATQLWMELGRPWENGSFVERTYGLNLRVRSLQLAGAGLFAPEPDAWVDEHAETA